MKYDEFFRAFYFSGKKAAITGHKSKVKIPEFFMTLATDKDADGVLPTSGSAYETWFDGARNPDSSVWE